MRQYAPTAPRNLSIAVLISLLVLFAAGPALGGVLQSQVGLGSADDFAVLSGETITNTGPTTITGDVGLHPGPTVDAGFVASVTLNGTLHEANATALLAKNDLITAYNDAAGRGPVTTVATELGGQTLIGGVYDSNSGTFGITGTLTLDGQDDPDTVFIFQMADTLIAESGSSVNFIRGAQACNVFWQVGSSATVRTNSTFRGTIMALTSITLETGATIEGRALARNGSVTMDTNTITRAACIPEGGVGTGGGSTSGAPNMILLLGGISLLAVAAGVFEVRRRLQDRRSG